MITRIKFTSFEEQMADLENRYYKQFTAMETAINKANSQSASLASFFILVKEQKGRLNVAMNNPYKSYQQNSVTQHHRENSR